MDYLAMLKTHVESGADVTIAAIPVEDKDAQALGIMRCDESGRVTDFVEKPQTDEERRRMRTSASWIDEQGIVSRGRELIASMGLYIFNRDVLFEILEQTTDHDFGKEVFPAAIRTRHVQAHLFDGYWEDIGTIRAFYEANLQLALPHPPFELVSPEAPVYSRARFLPPAVIEGASIKNSLIADGCRIGKGATIENSIVGLRCVIGEGVTIRNSIVMGSDYFETPAEVATSLAAGRPQVGVGAGSFVLGAILDKNCRVGSNVRIENRSELDSSDEFSPCLIRDGIAVLVKNGILPNSWEM
jgi:glucose-1-phosphate adenylyltransferase